MPIPAIPDRNGNDHDNERERLLAQSQFSLEVSNFKEIGEVLSAYSRITDSYDYVGTAEIKLDGTIRTLTITLAYDEMENFRCVICHRIPARPTSDNPGICTMCGRKVCAICWKRHEKDEWKPPVKTIGGKDVVPF